MPRSVLISHISFISVTDDPFRTCWQTGLRFHDTSSATRVAVKPDSFYPSWTLRLHTCLRACTAQARAPMLGRPSSPMMSACKCLWNLWNDWYVYSFSVLFWIWLLTNLFSSRPLERRLTKICLFSRCPYGFILFEWFIMIHTFRIRNRAYWE